MNALERTVLWLGVEDYTGLWDICLEAAGASKSGTPDEARGRAHRTVASFLADGLIELFVCHGPPTSETIDRVPATHQDAVLDDASSWGMPEEGGQSFWIATTDRGFAIYKAETGWTAS